MMAAEPVLYSELAHDRRGSGEPLVLIHGLGHRRQAWYPLFDRLAADFDVIAVDLAGFGESAPYPAGLPYNMENACRHFVANCEQLGIERPHVVGNSMGGAIALELGARDLVSSVTALSPAGFFARPGRLWALGVLGGMRTLAQAPDPVLRWVANSDTGRRAAGFVLYANPLRHDADATLGDSRALKGSTGFWRVAREGLGYRFIGEVNVPTTIAWGTRDRILPYWQAARARRQLPGAAHVPLKGAGHVPMADAPDEIIELIHRSTQRADEVSRTAQIHAELAAT